MGDSTSKPTAIELISQPMYVASAPEFPLLDGILTLETCLEGIRSIDLSQGSMHPQIGNTDSGL